MMVRQLQRHLPAALLGLLFMSLAVWSWRKWPDPLVDFGRELYVPWQLTRGKMLYRDVASIFGPLSPYLNAFWFRLFGVSISTLFFANLTILALTAAGIHLFVRRCADRLAAHLSTAAFLALCGFSQYLAVGNYNFVAPYSHEATHGFALSVGALICVDRALTQRARVAAATGGLCFGLVYLTKPEIFLALSTAVITGLGSAGIVARRTGSAPQLSSLGLALYLALFAIVPPVLFLGYFATRVTLHDATRDVLTAWTAFQSAPPLEDPFYRSLIGLDHTAGNILRMLRTTMGLGMCVAAAAVLDLSTSSTSVPAGVRKMVPWLVRLSVPLAAYLLVPWDDVPMVFLPVACVALLVSLVSVASQPRAVVLTPSPGVTMAAAFSIVMLGKIALNAQLGHYGFFLAAPALVLVTAVMVSGLPTLLGRLSAGAGRVFREAAVLALAAGVVVHLVEANRIYRMKTLSIGEGSNRFLAFDERSGPQGPLMARALSRLQAFTTSDTTLAVLPEGAMLNFLTERSNPVRYVTLMPPEIKIFGERAILSAFEATPPDVIVLAHKDAREYGFRPFGLDARYGASIMVWVRSHYRSIDVVGRKPLSEGGQGFELLERLRVQPTQPADRNSR